MATHVQLQALEAQMAKLAAKRDKLLAAKADAEARRAKKREVIEPLVAQLNEHEITLGELKAYGYAHAGRTPRLGGGGGRSRLARVMNGGSDARSTVAPKYRDTVDANNTWSGRGRAPRWLQAYLDAGRNKDEFLISK